MEYIYEVVTENQGAKIFTAEEFFDTFKPTEAETNLSRRVELQGQPKLLGVNGPMFGGIRGNKTVIRYERSDKQSLDPIYTSF